MPVAVFTDFDGTITLDDCNDALVQHYLTPEKRGVYETAFATGEMVLWRLLDVSLRACDVPLAHALDHLHGCVRVDKGFAPFYAWCVERDIPIAVVSAGTEAVVRSFLEREGLADLPVTANQIRVDGEAFGLAPLDDTCPTGVDKAAIILAARAAGYFTVFIGDGFSDRLAAPHADLVYAKNGLATWCEHRGVAHVRVRSFAEIQADLTRRIDALPVG